MRNHDNIKVETETGRLIEVVVTSFNADAIWILIGQRPHSSKCKLEPTRNGLAYAGNVMGREVIYPRSVEDVRKELSETTQHRGDNRRSR